MATAKTPRQKMINMMYLVLIAFLALNVDKKVLDAFHTLETNIIGTTTSIENKSVGIMQAFEKQLQEESVKTKPYYLRAKKAREVTQNFIKYIGKVKKDIEVLYDGRMENNTSSLGTMALKSPERFELHARYFMVENNGARAQELKQKIIETSQLLTNLLKPGQDSLFTSLNIYNAAINANQLKVEKPVNNGAQKLTWEMVNIENQPAAALMATLSQFQSNARSLEADVLTKLAEGINLTTFKIDELRAEILPESNYVMEGETYKAKVLMVATNKSTNPQIELNGNPLKSIENGVGLISIPASGIGNKSISGVIKVKNPKTGKMDEFTYKDDYQVFKPVATVSPEKMNLLYVGLKNPISISVPGYSANDISVNITSGETLNGSNGRYFIKPSGRNRSIKISVKAKGKDMGTTEFRVRNVSEPNGKFGRVKNDGRAVSKHVIKAQTRLFVTLGEDFAYDLTWNVLSYRFIIKRKNGSNTKPITASGSIFSPQVKQVLNSIKKGDILIVDNIQAKEQQYGIKRSVPPINIPVK